MSILLDETKHLNSHNLEEYGNAPDPNGNWVETEVAYVTASPDNSMVDFKLPTTSKFDESDLVVDSSGQVFNLQGPKIPGGREGLTYTPEWLADLQSESQVSKGPQDRGKSEPTGTVSKATTGGEDFLNTDSRQTSGEIFESDDEWQDSEDSGQDSENVPSSPPIELEQQRYAFRRPKSLRLADTGDPANSKLEDEKLLETLGKESLKMFTFPLVSDRVPPVLLWPEECLGRSTSTSGQGNTPTNKQGTELPEGMEGYDRLNRILQVLLYDL